ncbi:endo-beta-N-acetylglucosaminidase [Paenibacillus jiagnxiensis]|uniref:endo-beta-N-acetylglucosaminidase n=1 Tax=Paenibacillus jiagnxiensis TaxID=3228926 RepID=UPI0033BB3F0D
MTRKGLSNKRLPKMTALALSAALLSQLSATPALAGDTLPYEGISAKGENQPYQHGYTSAQIMDWTPESDIYGDLLRARVPLQPRNAAFAPTQANPELSPDTQMFTMSGDYGNAFFDSTPYTNKFGQYLYNYWQYTDYYGYWHGMASAGVPEELYDPKKDWTERYFEFGILNIPNPAYTNAAHKNGVLSIANIFFSDNDRGPQTYKQMLVQDENGEFPVARKLVEMAEYYGYDGYFFNQEEVAKGVTPEDIPAYKKFMKYLRDQGMYVQWYDSTVDGSGKIDYQNEFNSANSPFVKDAQLGRVSDSIFLNYWWNHEMLAKSRSHAESLGLDPLESVFAGVEGGNDSFGRWKQKYDLRWNLDENGQPMNSIATLGADFTHNGLDEDMGNPSTNHRADSEYQWMTFVRDRAWWSGPNQDPTDAHRNTNASLSDVYASGANWDGIAAYIAERSVIRGGSFFTSFNTGHGLDYVKNGVVSSDQEWSNINIQDIPVTWQWWIDTTGERLNVDFDYGPQYEKGPRYDYKSIGAYNGGSSLVVNGKLDAENLLRLFKTDLTINEHSKATLTYNKPAPSDSSSLSLGLIFADAPNKVVKVEVPDSGQRTDGWKTVSLDLSPYAGKNIAALGLSFDNNNSTINAYQMNIGELRITDGSAAKPEAPSGFRIDKALTNTGEMVVAWDIEDYDKVKQYNLYENGSYVGGIYDSTYYIKSLKHKRGELSITAVGADGTESEPATLSYDLTAGVRDVKVTFDDHGDASVAWKNAPGAAGPVELTLETEYTNEPFSTSLQADAGEQQAVITGLPKNGEHYVLNLSIDGQAPVTVTGQLADLEITPYAKELVTVTGGTYTLALPTLADWHRLYVYENDVPREFGVTYTSKKFPYIVRGRTKLSELTFKPASTTSSLKLVIEDYAGNRATTILR